METMNNLVRKHQDNPETHSKNIIGVYCEKFCRCSSLWRFRCWLDGRWYKPSSWAARSVLFGSDDVNAIKRYALILNFRAFRAKFFDTRLGAR
jgi:hypothetical protein